jgi:hypothetical protein
VHGEWIMNKLTIQHGMDEGAETPPGGPLGLAALYDRDLDLRMERRRRGV